MAHATLASHCKKMATAVKTVTPQRQVVVIGGVTNGSCRQGLQNGETCSLSGVMSLGAPPTDGHPFLVLCNPTITQSSLSIQLGFRLISLL